MSEHYFATIDRGRLRIYAEAKAVGQRAARLEMVEAIEYPRFADAGDADGNDAREDEGDLDHRRREMPNPVLRRGAEARRNTELLASELDTFLQNRPQATWDFAAAPSLYPAVIEGLSAATRGRLQRVLPKAMANQRAEEVRAQFAAVGE